MGSDVASITGTCSHQELVGVILESRGRVLVLSQHMDTTLGYLTGCDWSFVKTLSSTQPKCGRLQRPEGKQWLLSEEMGEWASTSWLCPLCFVLFFETVPLCNLLNNLKVQFCGVKCSHFVVPFKFCCAHLVAMSADEICCGLNRLKAYKARK